MKFEIWQEGYRATGDQAPASKAGEAEGDNFKAACEEFAHANPEWAKYFDSARMTHWGCRLFDNEADARKSFG